MQQHIRSSSPHAHRTGHYALGQVHKARHPGSWPVHISHLSFTQLSNHSSARLTSPALAAASQQYEGIYSNLHASCPRRSSCPSHLMSPLSVRIACSTHPARTVRGHQTQRSSTSLSPGPTRAPHHLRSLSRCHACPSPRVHPRAPASPVRHVPSERPPLFPLAPRPG